MSWNERKTAQGALRQHFWLYLVGNLRADLQNAIPFVRAVHDPFGTLASMTSEDIIRKRTVQLRVREFAAADELTLDVRSGYETVSPAHTGAQQRVAAPRVSALELPTAGARLDRRRKGRTAPGTAGTGPARRAPR
jgi:hypothetical protein